MYDAIIIGGSYAGLSAAMMLARARRKVLVLDAGFRRNRFAARSHGVLAMDGEPGADIAARVSAQLAAYPTVDQVRGLATAVGGGEGAFRVTTEDGPMFQCRKLLLATGVADGLPDIPGLAERWGRSVFHCPYCHGYEIGGGRIGLLATGAPSAGQASTLAGGDTAFVEAVFLTTRQTPNPLAVSLGCAMDETPHGLLVRTDATKLTSVPGIYAAGDTARLPSNVTLAAAHGVLAGAGLHAALVERSLEEIQG